MRLLRSKYAKNACAAGAPPRPSGELTALPQTPSWIKAKGKTAKGREGKGREGRKHKGRGGEDGEGKNGPGGKEKGWKGRGLGP